MHSSNSTSAMLLHIYFVSKQLFLALGVCREPFHILIVSSADMHVQIVFSIEGSVASFHRTRIRVGLYMDASDVPNQILRSLERSFVFTTVPSARKSAIA
ncbi:hypothetical protein D8B26_004878 [Coccidioides posadasii str. Silveira]|uniref:uncharacterized protein n=1 Tax=Coccidioides posadasii (strain RMSCC 757 / Silveira) TaxID=443226 RepID=UPI001BF157D0|nr:hypothetical protein D8B26_004878 [Coccidioides posadasii str. Silveira]